MYVENDRVYVMADTEGYPYCIVAKDKENANRVWNAHIAHKQSVYNPLAIYNVIEFLLSERKCDLFNPQDILNGLEPEFTKD